MPDSSNMCINVMTAPWSRVRHWSAPERLEWTASEKSDAAESTTPTLKPTMNRSASAASLGCRSMDDFGLITTRSSGNSPPAYDNCNDDQLFSDFYPLDCNDDELSDDPFLDDPAPAVEDSRPMTSDEMSQSLLRFWSFKTSSDDFSQSPVASAGSKSAARCSCASDNCSCGERLEGPHRCDRDLGNAETDLINNCVSSDVITQRDVDVDEQQQIAATAFSVPETTTESSGLIRQRTQIDSLPPEPDSGRADSQHWWVHDHVHLKFQFWKKRGRV